MDFSNELISLIREQENERAKFIIESFCLHNSVDTTQATLLHYCAKSGNENLTKYLLDRGCFADPQDVAGKTPLVMSMRRNHGNIIKMLLTAGVDLTAVNKENRSPLHYFATEHKLTAATRKLILQELQKKRFTAEEMGRKMLEAGIVVYQAVSLNNPAVIRYMLEHGSDSKSTRPICKQTALHTAVALEHVEIVRLLLDYGAEVNAIDIDNANPLFYIYQQNKEQTNGKLEILQMLLSSGISLQTYIFNGLFQVTHALAFGSREIVRAILQTNIDFTAKDRFHRRPILHSLAMNRNTGIVNELKHYIHKFDVNIIDRIQKSPLFVAVNVANVPMVKFLLKQGAETNFKQNNGYTPLHYAYAKSKFGFEGEYYDHRYVQIVELLLQYKANPQFIATDETGEQVTIFDTALKANNFHRLKPVVSHLAMLQAQGTTITEIMYSKINSHETLKEYFYECRQILDKKAFGVTTFLELITGDRKKLAIYLNDEKFLLKVERMNYKLKIISVYPYYYNSLKRKLSKVLYNKRFKKKAVYIVSKILQGRFDRTPHLIDKMVVNLNHENLYQLYKF